MKTSTRLRDTSFAAALALSLGAVAHAAPLQITDISLSGSFTAGTPETLTGNATLLSFTTSEGTFSSLLGATANTVSAVNTPYSIGTVPANTAAAVSGLSVNDAANNMGTGRFQFTGLALNASTRFFVLETTPTTTYGDNFTVTLIDATNTQVGSFSLSVLASNFTQSSLTNVTYTSGTGTLTGGKLSGVAFSFADLGVTNFASISTVTGIAINGNNVLDASVVGAFSAVPEPSSYAAIAGLLGLAVVGSRRRRA